MDLNPTPQSSTFACLPLGGFEQANDPQAIRLGGVCMTSEALIWAQARVLRAACRIESRLEVVLDWYGKDPISALGGYTAEELVSAGLEDRVIGFLGAIAPEETDQRIAA